MNKIFHALLSFVVLLIVVVVTPLSHVSAMQSNMPNSGAPEHCTMLCQNADTRKENELANVEESEDDEPTPPYYLQFESVYTGLFVEKNTIPISQTIYTPEKVPKYRSCCVIRR